jgi:hypothetical protein
MATNINPIEASRLTLEDYSILDINLISEIPTVVGFNPSTDYIEYFIYNLDGSLVYAQEGSEINNFTDYRLIDNSLYLNPEDNINTAGFYRGNYNAFYSFLSNRLGSSNLAKYFISEISSDRTEIRLTSNTISDVNIVTQTNNFISERNQDQFFPDFYLNFGENKLIIANNIALDDSTVLIKLYEALPPQFQLKSTCYVVEEIASPIAYNIQFIPDLIEIDDSIKIKGPNLNLNVKNQTNISSQPKSLEDLISTDLTASLQQINSYYQDTSIAINVDYTNFSNFINFSSAEKRVSNFFYKLEQIENWTSLASSGSNIVSQASSSTAFFESKINETINEFDTYEYYLYFSSGSTPYPKTNTSLPYTQSPTTSSAAQNWITGSLASGSIYDVNNLNWIYFSIPLYIREDAFNQSYVDFCNMVGHFYDENIWIYVKDITNKWDNDNRIDSGISRDLIAQQLRDLGFTIYENNFSSFNLFTSTLGITPSGSAFPYAYMTGSLPTPTGFEYVNNFVTGSNEILPQDDVNKRLYKRIYNALPYLYKKKGTADGLRALATIYGVPDTLLQINEFGSKDKDNTNDYDFWFNQFNYKFDTGVNGFVSSSWDLNPNWDNSPSNTVQLRFKTPGLDSALAYRSQSLWALNTDVYLALEYTGSGYVSASFSGSTPDPYNEYANLIIYPDYNNTPEQSASVYLPFFDGGWWSAMVTLNSNRVDIYAGNNIYNGSDGSSIGFFSSQSVSGVDDTQWLNSTVSYFASASIYPKFSGSLQEIRYFTQPISGSVFADYVMNPQSIEGNSINSAPDQLAFRASLGGELYTGSASIHPKVSGSWIPIPSFTSDSNFYYTGSFSANNEYVYMDQPAVGIKNRVSDKIRNVSLNLPAGNQQLSNIASIQQDNNTANGAYTDTVNLVEVALSPTNQINDDIIDSLGYFNIGEYIGDPRLNLTGSNTYPDLVALSNDYFLKYTGNYDWNDFVRLIKFFDNSLFKLIKDFVPAKVSSATGITIKQHLLERNKYPEPQVSRSFHELTGSIGQIPYLLDYQRAYSASTDYQSFPIVVPSGSDGGTLPNFVLDTNYTDFVYPGAINVTQSWTGSNITPFGFEPYTQADAREFIDGEFSGSTLVVTTQSLNPNNPFHSANTVSPNYDSDGYTGVNPTAGNFLWSWTTLYAAGQPASPGTATGYGVSTIWIHEEDLSSNNISSVLDNLSAGDQITFSIRTQGIEAGSPCGTATNKTVTQTIFNINRLTTSVYRIDFLNSSIDIVRQANTGFCDAGLTPLSLSNKAVYFNPYLNVPNFDYSPFNAVINNALIPRQSEIFWDLDYQSNAIQAVNQQVIISASQQGTTLPKAFVQDYNWYCQGIKNSHYLGASSTANDFNLPATEGGYGQLPVVQSEGYYFAFFNWVGGTSPEWGNNLEDRSAVNVRYYIDENANVIEPINDSNGVNLSIVQQNFEQDSNAILSFNDKNAASSPFANLEGTHPIFKSGQRPTPIIYTQTSSIGSNPALPNQGGGYTGSINFVQGDQAGTTINDYTIKSYANGLGWSTSIQPNFPNIVTSGSSVTLPSPYRVYTIDSTDSPTTDGVTLNFEAEIYSNYYQNKGVTFQWYKGATAVGSPKVWDAAADLFFFINLPNISDAVNTNTFQLKINSIGASPSTGITDPGPLDVDSTSFIWVYQVPSPNIGPAQLHWTINSSLVVGTLAANQIAAMPSSLTEVGLRDVYGQRQTDISGSGFNPITDNFVVRVGDEIRFGGTETQTFYIKGVSTANGDVILTLDRNLPPNLFSEAALRYYLLRRYVNDPSYILLSVDKPAGGTSVGVLTPEYFYGGTEEKVNSILKTLTTEQLIG